MPHILSTRCGDPMCGELAINRGRCETHQRKPWANASANSRALSGADRNRWRKLVIKADSRCEVCGTADDLEADHRISVSDGGAQFDTANSSVLCHTHHLEKTLREREQNRKLKK